MDHHRNLRSNLIFDGLLNAVLEMLNDFCLHLLVDDWLYIVVYNHHSLILDHVAHVKINLIFDHILYYVRRLVLDLLLDEQFDVVLNSTIDFLSHLRVDCGRQVVFELILDNLLDATVHLLNLYRRFRFNMGVNICGN